MVHLGDIATAHGREQCCASSTLGAHVRATSEAGGEGEGFDIV